MLNRKSTFRNHLSAKKVLLSVNDLMQRNLKAFKCLFIYFGSFPCGGLNVLPAQKKKKKVF